MEHWNSRQKLHSSWMLLNGSWATLRNPQPATSLCRCFRNPKPAKALLRALALDARAQPEVT